MPRSVARSTLAWAPFTGIAIALAAGDSSCASIEVELLGSLVVIAVAFGGDSRTFPGGERALRILMIAPTPFFAHRGCHVRIAEEIVSLRANGHQILLCTYGLGDEFSGVDTVRSFSGPWYRKLTAGPSWHKLYLDVFLFVVAWRTARRFRPDVLHAHLHEGVLLAAPICHALAIPMVADLQGSLAGELLDHGMFDRWRWGERLFASIERVLNRVSDEVIVSTDSMVERVGMDRRRRGVSVVADGVDVAVFRTDAENRRRMRRRLRFVADDIVVAFLGLLTSYQGVDLLLESAVEVIRQLPNVRFLIMGFPNEEAYRAQARRLCIAERVHFTGRVPYAESPAHLAAADLAVAPKLSPTEGNQKILNYMALGLPTVCFDTAINRAMLGDLGVYAPLGDRDDLARGLVKVASDPAFRRKLGGELRDRAVTTHSWDASVRKLEAVYARLIGPSPESQPRTSGEKAARS